MNKLLLILILVLGTVTCFKSEKKIFDTGLSVEETYYTCAMHPSVKEHKPGKCPICHMNLTKVVIDKSDDVISSKGPELKVEKEVWVCADFPDVISEVKEACPMDGTPMIKKVTKVQSKAALVVAKVKLRSAQLSHFKPDYFPVSTMKMKKRIRLLGTVLQSEEKESNIPARMNGRVEKVYVKSTGSFVKIGDPVIDLYSPKLITAGEEYLLARHSSISSKSSEFKDMLNQSKERLKLWGIKKFQYEGWFKANKVPKKITIYSPSTGIVRKRNATVGKYFKEGQNFFELSDLSDVWVEIDVYEHDASLVQIAQQVELEFTSLPGHIVQGELDFISPVLSLKSRTLKVRATVSNTLGKLKPGMVASATLLVEIEGEPLVVPRSAIIDTGKRKVVWIKVSDKKFQAKVIHTGYESDGYVEIKHGLTAGEEVVIEGNFLLDAQAQLFGGYEDIKKDTIIHKH
jgi:hypothetical protein